MSTDNSIAFARELAHPDFSLSVPSAAKRMLAELADALEVANKALDEIATRVTPDDYDNPSSALESIGDSIIGTGRTIEGY